MKAENIMVLAEAALEKGDAKELYRLLEQAQKDIASLIRVQSMYASMEGKAIPSGDMEAVKEIAMEAMSMAKLIIQKERPTP